MMKIWNKSNPVFFFPSVQITRRRFIKTSALGLGALSLGISCQKSDREGQKPNIILIQTDDQRWDALGCAGNPIIQTPNMDRLASQGLRFARAFATTPICAASRASIFTGLYEQTHEYTFTKPPLDRSFTDISYPLLLRQVGYRTGFIGKFGIKVEKGVADEMFDWVKWSSLPYFKENAEKGRHLTETHGDYAIEFLRGCKTDQPFCLSLSFWAPHAVDGNPQQYFWPAACDNLYRSITLPVPETANPAFFEALPEFLKKSMNRIRWYWRFDNPEKYQEMVKGYYRMISGVDMVIGRIMDELTRLGMARNTVILLTSDNGYFLGERGFAGKWLMHDLSIRVPLIVYDPRRAKEKFRPVRKEMVLNVDIAPTILDLAGMDIPKIMQGRSLMPLMRDEEIDWRTNVFCEHLWDHPEIPQSECIRTDRWKYIRYPQHLDFQELYDLEEDPREKNNLAFDQRYRTVLLDLKRACEQKIHSLSQWKVSS